MMKHFVGQPIMAAAGFQRHDATGSRWIEPLTAPQNRLVENKWFIGAVTGEPALFTRAPVGFRPPETFPKGPSVARVNALRFSRGMERRKTTVQNQRIGEFPESTRDD
jgi:hypothetical protein